MQPIEREHASDNRVRLQISTRYFRKIVREEYTLPLGWVWARETYQNSYDAGAGSVEYITGRDHRGPWIEVRDDGTGMADLQDMFTLGGDTKQGDSVGGGFGTAKEIVLLSWPHWELESQGQLLTSDAFHGGAPPEQVSNHRGTRIRVWHEDEIHPSDVMGYLKLTSGVNVNLDGNSPPRLHRGTLRKKLDWCDVWANGSPNALRSGHLIVRAEGITMFTEPIQADLMVVLQIKGKSTQYLPKSREKFRYPYSSDVWDIVRDFEQNSVSLKRAPQRFVAETMFRGGGLRVGSTEFGGSGNQMDTDLPQTEFASTPADADEIDVELPSRPRYTSGNILGEELTSNYDPATSLNSRYPRDIVLLRPEGRQIRLNLSLDRYARILYAWEGCVEACLNVLLDIAPGITDSIQEFRVGFAIRDEVHALYHRHGSNAAFLLNPRNISVSGSHTDQVKNLLFLASHEVAHILFGHGEEFDLLWSRIFRSIELHSLMRDPRVRCLSSQNAHLLSTLS